MECTGIEHRYDLEEKVVAENLDRQRLLILPSISFTSIYLFLLLLVSPLRPVIIILTSASGSSLTRKSIRPFAIQLAGVSPGCTRAVMTTAGRVAIAAGLPSKEEMVRSGHALPAMV